MYGFDQNISISKFKSIRPQKLGLLIIIIIILYYVSKIYESKTLCTKTINNNVTTVHNIDKTEFKHETLVDLFVYYCNKYHKYNALSVRKNGLWIYMTYKEYLENTYKFAKGLSMVNLEVKDSVGIIGHNSPAWFISHMGSIMFGSKSVGIYGTSKQSTCEYISSHSNIKVLVSDKKINLVKFTNKIVRVAIIYDDIVDYADYAYYKKNYNISLFTWKQFMVLAEFSDWKIRKTEFYNKKIATLIYTSGTTGDPKAVSLSHQNIIQSIQNTYIGIQTKINFNIHNEKFVSYLPLNHIAAQMIDLYMPIVVGGTVYFADDRALKDTLQDTLIEIKPTIFMGVPRVWEKIKESIDAQLYNNTFKTIAVNTVSKLIINKIGLGNCKLRVTGAAPIDNETGLFFNDLGIPLTNIYGMSETTGAITISSNNSLQAGKILPLTEVKILKKLKTDKYGEILVNGPTIFSGYYRNQKETQKSFYGNMFRTGDLGYIDKSDNLHVTGRSKELIITKGGENIAPVQIEQMIKKHISEAIYVIVIGDKRKYLTALINIGKHKVDNTKIDEAFKIINKKATSNAHTIKKYKLITDIFSYDSGELTNTLKLKRKFIENKYIKEINSMYQ